MLAFWATPKKRVERQEDFPEAWRALLAETATWQRLGDEDRTRLERHILIFLDQKRIEGANGMSIDDAVRLTIASQACLLLLHREVGYYPSISSIVIYPGEYLARWQEMDESGIIIEGEDCRSGECVGNGALVLSWEDVAMAGVDENGAYNVVIHEFAHLLDEQCGITKGHSLSNALQRELEREFHRLQHDAAHRRPALFDHYGAGDLAEFFAVATETFFENSRRFRQRHSELYARLSAFFNQDPAAWPGW